MTPTESTSDLALDVTRRAVLSVPEAGAVLGLGRSASYEAVRRREIPSLRIGRRILVPVPQLLALITGEQATEVHGVSGVSGCACSATDVAVPTNQWMQQPHLSDPLHPSHPTERQPWKRSG